MTKKIVVAFFIASCAAFLIVGVTFLKESGVLRKKPPAEYLTEEEAAVRPIYGLLSDGEKAVYTALLRGITNGDEIIPLPRDISGKVYSKIYCIVEKQESELFYADSKYYTAEIVGEAKIAYRGDISAVEEKRQSLRVAKKKALNMVKGGVSELDKAKRIHDYIIKNCKYIIGENELYASTAYGCLVEGKANCEGYAKAFRLLASECGMECVLVTGKTDKGENHAWNQLKIGGEWYNLDVTWDDTDVAGDIRKTYFLCSDDEFRLTHIADNAYFKAFECSDSSKNYYSSNDLLIDSAEKTEEILRREIKAGKSVIELKFTTIKLYNDFKRIYLEGERLFDLAMECTDNYEDRLSVSLTERMSEKTVVVHLDWSQA